MGMNGLELWLWLWLGLGPVWSKTTVFSCVSSDVMITRGIGRDGSAPSRCMASREVM